MSWLQKKYIALMSPYVDGLVQKSERLWNMRCSYCGDSSKNKSKKRGYLFEKSGTVVYKCHNCGVGRPFGKFLQENDGGSGLYRQYIMETMDQREDSAFAPVKEAMAKKDSSEKALSSLKAMAASRNSSPRARSVEVLFDSILDKVSSLPEGHPARVYLAGRYIPEESLDLVYWIEDIRDLGQLSQRTREKLEEFTHKESRVIIPAFDGSGKLIGITARDVTGKSSLRYIALKVSDDEEPMVFGANRYNPNKMGYIVEGPLDSLFLPNCLAVGGSDFGKVLNSIPKELVTFVFDNQPLNREVVHNYERYIKDGYRVFIWPSDMNWKDVKDINNVAEKYPNYRFPENMVALIEDNSFSGLTAQIKLAKWIKGSSS